MLNLSDILIGHPELESFDELVEIVRLVAASERFFRMDVRPPYPDTPHNGRHSRGCLRESAAALLRPLSKLARRARRGHFSHSDQKSKRI